MDLDVAAMMQARETGLEYTSTPTSTASIPSSGGWFTMSVLVVEVEDD